MAAGLRRGRAKPRWHRIAASPAGIEPVDTIAKLREIGTGGSHRLADALARIGTVATLGDTGAWGEDSRLAVLIDIEAGVAPPSPGPWSELVDEVVIGGARVGGDRSVELFAAH